MKERTITLKRKKESDGSMKFLSNFSQPNGAVILQRSRDYLIALQYDLICFDLLKHNARHEVFDFENTFIPKQKIEVFPFNESFYAKSIPKTSISLAGYFLILKASRNELEQMINLLQLNCNLVFYNKFKILKNYNNGKEIFSQKTS